MSIWVQNTSGTTTAADAVWVLQKKSDGTGTLEVTGREVEDRIYDLTREGPLRRIAGEGEEVTQTEERQEILELLRENERMKRMVIERARRGGFPPYRTRSPQNPPLANYCSHGSCDPQLLFGH